MKRSYSIIGLVLLASIGYAQAAIAQVSADGTVGTIVSPGPVFNITGGTRPSNGPNLFHSFSQFSLPTGSSAIFQNDPTVQTIFSRVTGGSRSDINGTIQTQGNASLFLMNPNGIVFGPNAKLQLGGSFVGTTANRIKFEDGIEFSAANLTNNPLLSVKVPIGLQMGTQPGILMNRSTVNNGTGLATGLRVKNGYSLSLIGGEVAMNGGRLNALGGRIELFALAGGEAAQLTTQNNRVTTTIAANTRLTDITLNNSAQVLVMSNGGGDIDIRGQNVKISAQSNINAGITANQGTPQSIAGNINIVAPGSLQVSGASPISNHIDDNGRGQGGAINIVTGLLSLTEGGRIAADLRNRSEGQAGTINIEATRIDISGTSPTQRSGISSSTRPLSIGNGGTIRLKADNISVTAGAGIEAFSNGRGNAGNIDLQTNHLFVSGVGVHNGFSSTIAATLLTNGIGTGGNIQIETDVLRLTDGGRISTTTSGRGNAGNIIIDARSSLIEGVHSRSGALFPSQVSTNVAPTGFGNGGNLTFNTEQLTISQGGRITAFTNGTGNAGDISLRAKDVIVDGSHSESMNSMINNNVEPSGKGNGGETLILANSLQVSNRGQITSASSTSIGNAGNITLNIASQLTTDKGKITTQALNGQGGSLKITTDRLQMMNNSLIDSSTAGRGNSGAIEVNAKTIDLTQSTITSQSSSRGNSGSLKLITDHLGLRDNAIVSTAASSTGNAGNLTIQSRDQVILQSGSQITSRSTGMGQGGNVDLNARSLLLQQNSQINASTVSSDGGNLILNIMDLVRLNDRSLLNAEAGGFGNGGNIKINAGFVVGFGNSDIIANAVRGNGGIVEITTQGIFGLAYRSQLTPNNDITASSQYGINGTVQLNTLNLNPANALNALPSDINQSPQLTDRCASAKTGSFISTGRGGIPKKPIQIKQSNRPWNDLRQTESDRLATTTTAVMTPIVQVSTPIVEASGIEVDESGTVSLVNPQTLNPNSGTCAGSMTTP